MQNFLDNQLQKNSSAKLVASEFLVSVHLGFIQSRKMESFYFTRVLFNALLLQLGNFCFLRFTTNVVPDELRKKASYGLHVRLLVLQITSLTMTAAEYLDGVTQGEMSYF